MTDKHKATRSDPSHTPVSRLVYLYLHERRAKDGKGKPLLTPRHEATVLVPKLHNDPLQCANYNFLAQHCMEACARQPGWGGFPQGGFWPIKDGDTPITPKAPIPGQAPQAVDPAKYAYRKGHWVIEVGSVLEPGPRILVMQNGQALEIPTRVMFGKPMYKSGDYGHVSLHAYTFHNEKWGAKFGFEGVLFTHEGEAIGGQGGPRAAEAMFGGITRVAATGTAPLPAPGHPYAPGGMGNPPGPAAPQPSHMGPAPTTTAPHYPSAPQHHVAPPTQPYVPQHPIGQPPGPAAPPPPPPPAVPAHPGPALPPFPTR